MHTLLTSLMLHYSKMVAEMISPAICSKIGFSGTNMFDIKSWVGFEPTDSPGDGAA